MSGLRNDRPNPGGFRQSACAAALCLVVAIGCGSKPPDDPAAYQARVAAARAAKDEAFQRANDPIPSNRKAELLPLAYFPIDPEYHVAAVLKPATQTIIVKMPTSTGQMRDMRRVGTLEFTLRGQPMVLVAFTESDLTRLSVMFTDITSGAETYAGGRYIDLERTATNLYELDFNNAYSPYCYYNLSYECPFPPPENRLQIPIRAGERMKTPE